ncbi:PBSX family phage terminase large subunit [Listeria monocytogenes]|nr:PBSX family phage terminase large subunit [Listeria monocytogenes]EHB8396785.1 PBSX family phage terminase large subunit [Listeria monocytogenes]EHB8399862.1 PBSX family phage terminase large subunit [Listeria monocytogenes]EHB8402925.1 PBSX family phage terminase large subunit [Listeria monocytogenes]
MAVVQLAFSPKQQETIREQTKTITLEVNEGTPRSGKTTADIFKMANFYINSRDMNHLVTAYNQEQAFRLFMDGDGLGLIHIYGNLAEMKHDEHGDHLLLHAPNGKKKIYYKGGGKVNSVGAITGMSLGSVTFLEINLLHMDFVKECFRRTYAAKDRFHLAELNPPAPSHPVLTEVFDRYEKTGRYKWRHWTPFDNPILDEERRNELYNELKFSSYLLQRDWYGKRVLPKGIIYETFDMQKNQISKLEGRPIEMVFFGDGGQQDATVCECYVITEHAADGHYKYKFNQVASYYHSGRDTGEVKAGSTYAVEIKQFIQWCMKEYEVPVNEPVFIDPACRWLREELEKVGVDTAGADNNAHDVIGKAQGIEVGIERMQSLLSERRYLLVEQPNDQYDNYGWLQEMGMYVRDENSGKPVDKNNHAMDTSRYATNYFYRNYEDI